MDIRIAYLYDDILNLYGDKGNITVLEHQLKKQGTNVEILKLSIHDELNFNEYDFVYLGPGTEANQQLALEHLKKYSEEFKTAVDNGLVVLSTGNSYEMFGDHIRLTNDLKVDTLKWFDYYAEQTEKLYVCDIFAKTKEYEEKIFLGMFNQHSTIKGINEENALFTVTANYGSYVPIDFEGVKYNNFYGTYIVGPFLVRNPHFVEVLVKIIITNKDSNFEYKKVDNSLDYKAYDILLEQLSKDKNLRL